MTLTNQALIPFNHALDFTGKTVLVVGGSSGIGNGTAQTFRSLGAWVHVWGTRPDAQAYRLEEGCNRGGWSMHRSDRYTGA